MAYPHAMKMISALTSCAMLAMVSCEDMNGVGQSSGFDPLQVPGAQSDANEPTGPPRIRPGQFVTAAIDNTVFYNQRPGPEAEADKLLKRGTSMRVINATGSLLRVELDSGEVGFVPSVMAEQSDSVPVTTPTPAEFKPTQFQQPPLEPLPEHFPSDILPDVIEPELPTPDI